MQAAVSNWQKAEGRKRCLLPGLRDGSPNPCSVTLFAQRCLQSRTLRLFLKARPGSELFHGREPRLHGFSTQLPVFRRLKSRLRYKTQGCQSRGRLLSFPKRGRGKSAFQTATATEGTERRLYPVETVPLQCCRAVSPAAFHPQKWLPPARAGTCRWPEGPF